MAVILCFGDSITQGYTDIEGGWTQRVRKYLNRNYRTQHAEGVTLPSHDVFNLGISGAMSSDLLARFDNEVKPRLLDDDVVIVIAIGTNDTIFRKGEDKSVDFEAQLSNNLKQLIGKARQYTHKVILVGVMPCDESLMQPMPWSRSGKCYSNERLKRGNQVILDIARAENVPCVDIFDSCAAKYTGTYLADGIHPNEEGHTILAFEIQYEIEKLLKK